MVNLTDLKSSKIVLTSFAFLFIFLASTVSSTLLIGLAIFPQEVWANHLPPPSTSTFVPPTGSTVCDSRPDLDWADVAGANRYRVQIDNNNDFSSIEFTSGDLTGNSINNAGSGSGFADGTTQFWRVASRLQPGDALFGTPSSPPVSLIVDTTPAAPTAPTLATPGSFTNDNTPLFDWNADAGTVCFNGINRYTIQLSTSNALASGGVSFASTAAPGFSNDVNPPTTVFQVPPGSPIPDGNYFWSVRARDITNQEGQLGEIRSLTIDTAVPATAPGLLTPADGAFTNDNTPAFDWNDISDSGSPISYEYYYWTITFSSHHLIHLHPQLLPSLLARP